MIQLGFFENEKISEAEASYRGDWATPWTEFRMIDDALDNCIQLDVSAAANNAKCSRFFTAEQDALKQEWTVPAGGLWWCNPDFRLWLEFIEKAHEQMLAGNEGIMLLPANTDRPLFSEIEKRRLRVLFWGTDTPGINGRINFIDPTNRKRTANTKGSILIAFTNRAALPSIHGRNWWRVCQ